MQLGSLFPVDDLGSEVDVANLQREGIEILDGYDNPDQRDDKWEIELG